MSSNPTYHGPERRRKPMMPVAQATRPILPAEYYIDKWMVPPRQRPPEQPSEPRVETTPLDPTPIDWLIPELTEVVEPDYLLPPEPSFWPAWAESQAYRESHDSGGHGFLEQVTLDGDKAVIKRVNFHTNRVMEQQQRRFRYGYVIEPDPDLPREPEPVRIVAENRMHERIKETYEAVKRRERQLQHASVRSERRSQIPWAYMAGLASALALLATSRYMHLG